MATETDVDPAQFEDLPNTDIEVDLHVHFGMAGSFPLRLADLFSRATASTSWSTATSLPCSASG
ncbi:hypothetical protein ACFQJD_10165 [Haloplanus sp. GCM10025708]|uniref:hypothetical protein n=1 Tax=Haloplanus sp. GCM10025708 TaxID=3252679 RepID=UPI00361EB854